MVMSEWGITRTCAEGCARAEYRRRDKIFIERGLRLMELWKFGIVHGENICPENWEHCFTRTYKQRYPAEHRRKY